ncbi:MAG TPA: hypothetical protein VKS79_21080 [Gemmataceae bacterium]|nr:hypothetical protein [Gemmataceae bacterium]
MSFNSTRQRWFNKPLLGSRLDLDWAAEYGVVGYWLMNEGNGTTLNDLTGDRKNGTYKNAASPQTQWGSGKSGSALGFVRASNNYVDFGAIPPSIQNPPVSVMLRVNPSSVANYGGFFSGGLSGGWYLRNTNTGAIEWLVSNVGGNFSGGSLAAGTWSDVGFTMDASNNVKIYQDGKSVATGGRNLTGSGNLILGTGNTSNNSEAFAGSIEWALVSSMVWTAAQISRLYANPYAGILAPNYRRWFAPSGGVVARQQQLTLLGCGA